MLIRLCVRLVIIFGAKINARNLCHANGLKVFKRSPLDQAREQKNHVDVTKVWLKPTEL